MTIAYYDLFSITVKHDFFAEPQRDFCEIVSTGACRELLRRNGMALKSTPNGCSVVYESQQKEGAAAEPLHAIDPRGVYVFFVKPKDSLFTVYSDIESNFYVVHNHNSATIDGMPSLSKAGKYLGNPDSENGQLKLRSLNFTDSFETNSSNGEETCIIRDGFDNQISSVTLKSDSIDKKIVHHIDLSGHGPGFYRICRGSKGDIPVYADDEMVRITPLIVIVLYGGSRGNQIKQNHRFIDDDGTISPKKFQLFIGARSAIWRYHVKKKPDSTIDLSGIKIPGCSSADGIVFVSDSPIKMAEYPNRKFSLIDQTGAVIIENLPRPDPKNVICKKNEPAHSNIYINI
jgi:hypothetical protein